MVSYVVPKWVATLLTSIWKVVNDIANRLGLMYSRKDDGELTFTPEAMIAATSFCQTSTVSQESLPDPAMVDDMCGCGYGAQMWMWARWRKVVRQCSVVSGIGSVQMEQ
jgi:hypothetical protein